MMNWFSFMKRVDKNFLEEKGYLYHKWTMIKFMVSLLMEK